MITPDYARTMARYNAEMNRRLYDAAGRLDDTRRREDRGLFWRSIHGTFSHLLWADQQWMARLADWERPGVPLAESDRFHDGPFEELRKRRAASDAGMIGWADEIEPEWLAAELVWFSGATRQEQRRPRALLVAHLFNHQTHHRGQVHAALTGFGVDPGATDLPFVLPG